nr:unnamed protein product [Digitaria exilis]
MASPCVQCPRRGDESEEESNGRRGEAPARCVVVVAAYEWSGFDGSTLSDGVWCCNGTKATSPAQRWFARCGAVWFSRFSLSALGYVLMATSR